IHVAHLFLIAGPCRSAFATTTRFFQKVSILDVDVACLQRFQVVVLAFAIGGVASVVPDPRGKIMCSHKLLIAFEKADRQLFQIQPVVALEPRCLQPKIEVEAIDVSGYALHEQVPSSANKHLDSSAQLLKNAPTNPAGDSISGPTPA